MEGGVPDKWVRSYLEVGNLEKRPIRQVLYNLPKVDRGAGDASPSFEVRFRRRLKGHELLDRHGLFEGEGVELGGEDDALKELTRGATIGKPPQSLAQVEADVLEVGVQLLVVLVDGLGSRIGSLRRRQAL